MNVKTTPIFDRWLEGLRDRRARVRIQFRIDRMELGNFGDAKSVGEGVRELRIDYVPGYRVYFVQRGQEVVILLCGGDKGSQARDIELARRMAKELK